MKKDKIIYWVATGLLSLMMTAAAANYIFNHAGVSTIFTNLGFPTYLIYPMAATKLLGVIAILTKKSVVLKNMAYVGFFYNFLLAASAHINVGDGEFGGSIFALILLSVSFLYDRKLFSGT